MAAALEIVYKFVKEGKVLGPFLGDARLSSNGSPSGLLSFLCGAQEHAGFLEMGAQRFF